MTHELSPQHEHEFSAEKTRRTARRTQWAAGAVSVLLVVGFVVVFALKTYDADTLASRTAAAVDAPVPVDVAVVKPASSTSRLSLPAQTAPWYETTIYARVDGYVGKWLADIGDRVAQGQVLATIETPELDAELDAARAKLHAAQADLQVSEAESRFAESTYLRWKESPKGVVSQQETEDKKAGSESAQAKLAAARAQINLAQGEVDRLTAFEIFKQVIAPFKGTITQRRIDVGNLVTAGSTAATTSLYHLVQDDPIRVFADVPQNSAAAMTVGTRADIATSGSKSRTYDGTITRTSDAVDPQSRTLRVEVDIPNHDGSLVSGLYVDATFHIASAGLSEIPAAALIFGSQGPRVAVIDNGRVAFRAVAIAEDDGSVVDLASGIKPGDKVVLNISSQIADGAKVSVNETDGQPPVAQTAIR